MRSDERRLEPEFIHDVEKDDNRRSKVGAEEVLNKLTRRHGRVSDRGETGPELGDEYEYVEDEADPGANHARLRAESKLVESVALDAPPFTEADMCQADGSPGEDGRQAGKGEHPVEGVARLARRCQEGEQSDGRGNANGDERAAFAVNVSEDLGRLVLFGERCESAGRAVNGRVPDG